ncbi:alpha/beta-hydrolase [Artomyces pyxidatus]|uniref:Alpha/beta-hydrolase n=1 Tax=Artomyces pyxidatus TaxID=48021 RepID=A0ACB8TE84_9AGAM|nr:alpha/beta-hydrolase [Artomyces pyxidatus]
MSSAMSSPGDCCIKTVQHTGDPRGVEETIGGVNTYVARPPGEQQDHYDRIILYFANVYGPLYINNRLLMDFFSSQGYLVLGVDYFQGDDISFSASKAEFDFMEWIMLKRASANELVPIWIAAVKSRYGHQETRYAALGYCFGAQDVINCVSSDWLAAGAMAHPSFLREEHFKTVKKPLFFSCAQLDEFFPMALRHRAEEKLSETRTEHHFQIFSDVEHGFAVRGDPDVPLEVWAKEQSASSIANWFDRFCK